MGRTKFTKEILAQIDRATNPDRNLGKVKIGAPKVLRFTEQEEIDNPQGVSFVFRKRYYNFDRGSKYSLNKVDFSSFAGKIFYGEVATNIGNFVDDGFLANTNLHYSVQIFSDKARTVKLKITSPVCSIVILNNLLEQFNSGDSFFSTGIINIALSSGWNTLDIFYYRQRTDGYLKIEGDIGNHISAWRPVDFEPPTKPQWHSTAVVSEYIDPNDFGQFHNVLRWKKYPSDVVSGELEDIASWDIYRSTPVNLVNTGGSNVTVVSGWGTDAFVVSGDYRSVLPSEGTLYSPSISDDYTISGTAYPGGTSAENYTIVTVSGTLSPGLSASDAISTDQFRPILNILNHPALPFVVSGLDTNILNGETYNYYIKAIDNSPNSNKSTKSDIKTIVAGDTSPPDAPTDLDIYRSFSDVTIRWTAPTDNDLAGFVIFVDGVEFDKIYGKDNTTYIIGGDAGGIKLDPAVEYTFGVKAFDYVGNLSSIVTSATKTGAIEGGQTDYNDDDNDGFWLGYDDGNSEYRMSMKSDKQKLTLTSSGLNIVSGTITAGTMQTATSGQRVVIEGSDNTLKFYDSGGNLAIDMDDDLRGIGLPGIDFPLDTGGVIAMGNAPTDYCILRNNRLFIHSTINAVPTIHGRNESVAIGGAQGVVGQFSSEELANTGDRRVGVFGTSTLVHADSTDPAVGVYAYGWSLGDAPAYGIWAHADADGGGVGFAGFFEGDVLTSGTAVTSKIAASTGDATILIETDSDSEDNFAGIEFKHRRSGGSPIRSSSVIRMREIDLHIECDERLFIKTNGLERLRVEGGGTVVISGSGSGEILQIGSPEEGNYTAFEDDGTIEFNGDATVWDDLRVPVTSVRVPGSKAPTWTSYSAGQLLAFDYQAVAGNEEEVYFVAQLPHSYKEGTNITPHVHWIPDTDEATLRWGLEYEWVNVNGSFSATTTIYVDQAVGVDDSDKQFKTIFSAIDGTGKTISSMLVCRLFRNSSHANDTAETIDALLIEIDFHFEMDTVGSRLVLTK